MSLNRLVQVDRRVNNQLIFRRSICVKTGHSEPAWAHRSEYDGRSEARLFLCIQGGSLRSCERNANPAVLICC